MRIEGARRGLHAQPGQQRHAHHRQLGCGRLSGEPVGQRSIQITVVGDQKRPARATSGLLMGRWHDARVRSVEKRARHAAALRIVTSVAWLGGAGPAPEDVLSVDGRSNANPSIAARRRIRGRHWGASAEGGCRRMRGGECRRWTNTFARPVRVSKCRRRRLGRTAAACRARSHGVGGRRDGVVWTAKAPAGTRLLSARSVDEAAVLDARRRPRQRAAAGNWHGSRSR